MALSSSSTTSLFPTKTTPHQSLLPSHQTHQPKPIRSIRPISAVHSPDPSKPTTKSTAAATSTAAASTTTVLKKKWAVDSWKTKKALQLPEYPDRDQLRSVLETLEAFPPIVFAGEARSLEERLGEAAMGNAFLLQGGDCAESFKEFHANNIRDTFRILLQMGAVLMFGGQMPVIKNACLDKSTGGVCLSISWRGLAITGIDDRRYWNHIPTDESSDHEDHPYASIDGALS